MATLLPFPCPRDARVAAELRTTLRDFHCTPAEHARVIGRFLRIVNAGRSNGVASYEALRELHRGARPVGGVA